MPLTCPLTSADRSVASISRALYRSDTSTYHSTVGDVVRFFQPVKDLVEKGLQEG